MASIIPQSELLKNLGHFYEDMKNWSLPDILHYGPYIFANIDEKTLFDDFESFMGTSKNELRLLYTYAYIYRILQNTSNYPRKDIILSFQKMIRRLKDCNRCATMYASRILQNFIDVFYKDKRRKSFFLNESAIIGYAPIVPYSGTIVQPGMEKDLKNNEDQTFTESIINRSNIELYVNPNYYENYDQFKDAFRNFLVSNCKTDSIPSYVGYHIMTYVILNNKTSNIIFEKDVSEASFVKCFDELLVTLESEIVIHDPKDIPTDIDVTYPKPYPTEKLISYMSNEDWQESPYADKLFFARNANFKIDSAQTLINGFHTYEIGGNRLAIPVTNNFANRFFSIEMDRNGNIEVIPLK